MEFFIMSHYHTIMVQCVWSVREGPKKDINYKWGSTEKKVSQTNEKNKIRIWLIANWRLFHNDPEKRHWELSFRYSHTSFVWCHHQSVCVCVCDSVKVPVLLFTSTLFLLATFWSLAWLSSRFSHYPKLFHLPVIPRLLGYSPRYFSLPHSAH